MFNQQKMYLLLVLATLVVSTLQQLKDPAFMKKMESYKEECAKEVGFDLAAANKASNENRLPNDNKFKCYCKCVNIKLGVLDASGEVVNGALGKVAPQLYNPATKAKIVEKCGPLKGADLCETAYKLMACIKAAELD